MDDETAAQEAAGLYDRCVEEARRTLDARPEQGYIIENGQAIDLGIFIGATAAFVTLRREGHLDD